MRSFISKFLVTALVVSSGTALARDTRYLLKIADVLAMPEAGRLDPHIKLFFGKSRHPSGESRGEVVANAKTNAANKGDEAACRWVMLTALTDLQAKARAVGATSVVGIESFYKKIPFSSETEFECHAGVIVAGVALRGQLMK